MASSVERLKRRREFLRVAGARNSAGTHGLVIQASKSHSSATAIRIGFTASKKVGNAVCRNRARRRLKALAGEMMPKHAVAGYDYVVIARGTTPDRSFEALRRDFEKALKRLKLWQGSIIEVDSSAS